MNTNVITMYLIIKTRSGRCCLFGSTDYFFRYVIPITSETGYSSIASAIF